MVLDHTKFVEAVNYFQRYAMVHPLTCSGGNGGYGCSGVNLRPHETDNLLVCPQCNRVQDPNGWVMNMLIRYYDNRPPESAFYHRACGTRCGYWTVTEGEHKGMTIWRCPTCQNTTALKDIERRLVE